MDSSCEAEGVKAFHLLGSIQKERLPQGGN